MTEEEMYKIALAKARDFKDGNPAPFLAQMEWEQHLMKEQHRFIRRLTIITAVATFVSGLVGGLIQRYGPDFPWWK